MKLKDILLEQNIIVEANNVIYEILNNKKNRDLEVPFKNGSARIIELNFDRNGYSDIPLNSIEVEDIVDENGYEINAKADLNKLKKIIDTLIDTAVDEVVDSENDILRVRPKDDQLIPLKKSRK